MSPSCPHTGSKSYAPLISVYIVTVKFGAMVYLLAAPWVHTSQIRDQQRFTISEVADDWHEPVVPQCIMWPSIARANGKLDPRCSQQTHHRPNQPHQAFTPSPQLLFISRPAEGMRLSWPDHTVGQQRAQGSSLLYLCRNLCDFCLISRIHTRRAPPGLNPRDATGLGCRIQPSNYQSRSLCNFAGIFWRVANLQISRFLRSLGSTKIKNGCFRFFQ